MATKGKYQKTKMSAAKKAVSKSKGRTAKKKKNAAAAVAATLAALLLVAVVYIIWFEQAIYKAGRKIQLAEMSES